MNRKQKRILYRILTAAALTGCVMLLPVKGWVKFVLYMIPYFVAGYDILRDAWRGILNRQVFDENFLMAVATLGAILLAVLGNGDYIEAIAVMVFYQTGELFQSIAVGKSRRNIAELMDIRPDYANILVDGKIVQVDPEEVRPGDEIVIRPGERVPIDGVIIQGETCLDNSAITGESMPCEGRPGTEVVSGSINLNGLIRVRTTREFGESTASRILELVENAASHKANSEAFISKFARVYTPAVCCGALLLALLPPAAGLVLGRGADWFAWIYRALTFLVISCPCALVISIPLSFFAGLGGAGSAGILIKGANYMETLAKVKCVVLDKTGTITQGRFEVKDVCPVGMEREKLLQYAALAESSSTHPIGRSILEACGESLDMGRVSGIHEMGGGVSASVDGHKVSIGNRRFMQSIGVDCPEDGEGGTVAHVAVDGAYSGWILISDAVKPTAAQAVKALRRAGVKDIVMLTGDAASVAGEVAAQVNITRYFAGLLPEDKVEHVERLLRDIPGGKLAFAGDGINDAPVLARSDVGIAMGALGSDAAIEAADVVLMDDDPLKIAKAIKHARRCMDIVYQNIGFAIGVKVFCLALGAVGIANMWLAIFADVGVMVIAVLNAARALSVKGV